MNNTIFIQAYWLTAGLMAEPNYDLWKSYKKVLQELEGYFSEQCHGLLPVIDEQSIDQYHIEYTKLFILNPQGIPAYPFASYWLDQKRLYGESSQFMENLLYKLGLTPKEESALAPDHIIVELELLAYLYDKPEFLSEKKALLAHLQQWLPVLQKAVCDSATLDLYPNIINFIVFLVNSSCDGET